MLVGAKARSVLGGPASFQQAIEQVIVQLAFDRGCDDRFDHCLDIALPIAPSSDMDAVLSE